MLTRLEALLLAQYATGESSEVLHIFSPTHGRLSVMVKGARSAKAKYGFALQPLHELELLLYLREGAELGTLREASVLHAPHALSHDPVRLALAGVLVELAAENAPHGSPAEELYAAARAAVRALEAESAPEAQLAAALRSTLTILRIAGYAPRLDPALLRPWPGGERKPRVFSLALESGRVSAPPRQPEAEPSWPRYAPPDAEACALPPAAVRFLFEAQHGGDPQPLPRGAALQFFDALLRFAESHLERPLRSARFWRDLTAAR